MIEKKLVPCSLTQIAASGQCFRMQACEGGWWRVCAGDRCVYIQQSGDALRFDCPEDEWRQVWRPYLDWDTDYQAFLDAVPAEDAFLRAAAAFGSGLRILRQELWETLVTFVISQNNNIPRIRAAVETLCRRWGDARTDRRGQAYYTFPDKAALARAGVDELRAAGLGYRDRYIAALAGSGFDADALRQMDAVGAHEALCALPGVGKKVAHCVQLFGLHDLAAFPVDTWIQKMCDRYYAGAFPVDQYPGFAGVIQQYIFFYGRSQGKKG